MTGPRRRRSAPLGPLGGLAELAANRRRLLGLTQRAAAELAGVGVSSIYAVEDGSDRITLAILLRIFDALGLALVATPPGALPADPQLIVVNGTSEP